MKEPVKYEGLLVFYKPLIEAGSVFGKIFTGIFGYVIGLITAFVTVVLTYFGTYALRRNDTWRPIALQLVAVIVALASLAACSYVYRLPIFFGILWALIPVVIIAQVGKSIRRQKAAPQQQ